MSLMSIVTILVQLFLLIGDIPAARHHGLFYFLILTAYGKVSGYFQYSLTSFGSAKWPSLTESSSPAACLEEAS